MADPNSLIQQAISPNYKQIAAVKGTDKGLSSATGLEADVRNMTTAQFLAQHGPDVLEAVVQGNIEYAQDLAQSTRRSTPEALYDTAVDTATGLAIPLLGIGAYGVGKIHEEAGAKLASGISSLNELLQGSQSTAMQKAREIQQLKQEVDTRESQAIYDNDIRQGKNPTIAGIELLGRNAISSISNTLDSDVLTMSGSISAIGSMMGAGLATKAIKAATASSIGKAATAAGLGQTKTLAHLRNIGSKATWPLVVGAMEGGGAYQEVVAEIMAMPFDYLAENSPVFSSLVQDYQEQGLSLNAAQEKARIDVATTAGNEVAAKQGVVGATTGILTRWAETPFKVTGGLKGLAKAAVSEVAEESIQAATGSSYKNIAVQKYADKIQDLLEGVGEEIGQSALFALGSVGATQGPGVVAQKTGKAIGLGVKGTKAAAGAIMDRADAVLDALEAKHNAPIKEKAATLATAAKVTADEITTAVNENQTLTPEEKDSKIAYGQQLTNSLAFDDKDSYQLPEGQETLLDGVTSRAEALSRVYQAFKQAQKDKDPVASFKLALLAAQIHGPLLNIVTSNESLFEAIPDDSDLGKLVSEYDSIAATVTESPDVQKVLSQFSELASNPNVQQNLTEQANTLDTTNEQQVQGAIDTAIAIAKTVPEKGNEALNNKLLTLESEGVITLDDTQKAALQVSVDLIKAAKAMEAQIAKAGKLKPRDVVSGQILGNETSDTNKGANAPSKLSAAGHARKIITAVYSQDYNSAVKAMQDFAMFIKHMTNKLEALNKHYLTGSPQERVVWDRLTFEGDRRVWKPSTGLMSQAVWPTSPNSVEYARNVDYEVKTLIGIYNGLIKAFPYLKQSEIASVSLAPKLLEPSLTTEPVKEKQEQVKTEVITEPQEQAQEPTKEVSEPPIQEIKKEVVESKSEVKIVRSRTTGKVILPIGTSGSGKSTWIKSLPGKFIIISPDEMRVEFTGNMNDKSKDAEIYETVKERTIEALKNNNNVIIDSTNLQKERRRDFINAIKEAFKEVNIEYKLMPLNPDLAKQRIAADIYAGKNRAAVPDSTIDRHAILYEQMLKDIKQEDITEFKETKKENLKTKSGPIVKEDIEYETTFRLTDKNNNDLFLSFTRYNDGSVHILTDARQEYEFPAIRVEEMSDAEVISLVFPNNKFLTQGVSHKPIKPIKTPFSNLIPKAKSLMEKAFKFRKNKTNRLMESVDPVRTLYEAIWNGDNLKAFLGEDARNIATVKRFFKNKKTLKAYQNLFNSRNENSLVNRISAMMQLQLDDFLNEANKDSNNLTVLLETEYKLNEYSRGKALNITVDDGKLVTYEPKLIKLAVLAAIQSYMNMSTYSGHANIEDVANMLSIEEEAVTENMLNAFTGVVSTERLKQHIADKIKQYWNVTNNKDVPYGLSNGIIEALAAELIKAMSTKEINLFQQKKAQFVMKDGHLLAYEAVNVDQSFAKLDPELLAMKPDIREPNLFKPVFPKGSNTDLFEFQDAIDSLVLVESDRTIYYDTSIPSVAQNQLRNPHVENTPQQKEAIGVLNHTPYKTNTLAVRFYNALGIDNILSLMGTSITDENQWNQNHLLTLRGQNLTISGAFEDMQMSLKDMQNYADATGIPLEEVQRYYSHNASKIGRFQMLGGFNPLNNKFIREIFLPTESVINMRNEESEEALYYRIALAQALGIKVNNQKLGVSSDQVMDLLDHEFAEVIEDLKVWVQQDDTALPTEIVNKIKQAFATAKDNKKKASISFVALHALIDYARLQATEDKSQFKTMLYLEADGVTNGIVNAMMLMNYGPMNLRDLQNLRKGGVSFGSKKSYAELREQDGKDLYTTIAEVAAQNTTQLANMLEAHNEQVANQFYSLIDLLENFSDGGVKTIFAEDEEGTQSLSIDRSIVKNPATIILYAAGLPGIAGNITDTVVRLIYTRMSEALQKQIADPKLSIAQAMFPDEKTDVAENLYKAFINELANLTELVPMYSKKKGYFLVTAKNGAKFNKNINLKTFTFTNEQFENIRQNMEMFFVRPLNKAVFTVLGEEMMDASQTVQKTTNAQSIIYKHLFNKAISDKITEVGKTAGRNIKDFLSENEILTIRKKLNKYEPLVYNRGQVFSVNKNERVNLPGKNLKSNSTYTDTLATAPNVQMPVEAGVLGVAQMNVGSGDARMTQIAVTRNIKGMQVFDGFHMPINEVAKSSEALNQAVYDSWRNNTHAGVLRTLDRMLNAFLGSKESLQEFATLLRSNSDLNKELARNFMSQKEVNEQFAINSAGFAPELLIQILLNERNHLADIVASVEARQKTFQELPVSIDQMASAEKPYTNKSDIYYDRLKNLTDQEMIDLYNVIYNKHYKAPVHMTLEGKTLQTIEKTSQDKYKATIGITVETGKTVINRLTKSRNNLSAAMKRVYLMLKQNPLVSDITFLTGSPESLIEFLDNNGIEHNYSVEYLIDKEINGTYIVNNNIIWLNEKNISTDVQLHEMIHAVTVNTLRAYYESNLQYADSNMLTPVNQAIHNLEMLAEEFLNLESFDSIESAAEQTRVRNIMLAQNRNTPEGQVKFLAEFIAYVLSSQKMIDALDKRKSSSPLVQIMLDAYTTLKNLLSKIFKTTNTPDDSFWNQVRFNTDIIMQTQPSLLTQFQDTTAAYNSESGTSANIRNYREKIAKFIERYSAVQAKIKQVTELKEIRDYSKLVINAVVAHDFRLDAEQQSGFQYIVQAMATEIGLDSATMARAQELYSHVIQTLSWEDLLTVPLEQATVDHTTVAQNQYAILTGKNSVYFDKQNRSSLLSTFLGLAMVSPEFRNVLSKMEMPKSKTSTAESRLDRAIEDFGVSRLDKLSSRLSGEKQAKNVTKALDNLFDNITMVLNDEQKLLDQGFNIVGGLYDRANEAVKGKLTNLSQTAFDKLGNIETSNKLLNTTVKVTRGLVGLANDLNAEIVSESVITFINNHKLFEGINALVSDLVGRVKSNANVYDMIKLVKATVQQVRQIYRDGTPKVIREKFKSKLSKEQWSSLYTSMAKTDLTCLNMPIETIRKFMTSETALAGSITKLEQQLSLAAINKAKQLAHYMITGEAGINLLRNAHAINHFHEGDVASIDKLVTLYSIRELSKNDKRIFASLVQKETEGMNFVMAYLKGQREEEIRKTDEPRTKLNYYKGYIPALPKQGVSLIVANDSNKAELLQSGYIRVGDYKGSSTENLALRGYYFSPVTQKAIFNQGIFQNINKTAGGVDATTGFTLNNIAGRITDKEYIEKLIARQPNERNMAESLLPVFDLEGNVIAFERAMSPTQLVRLDQNTDLAAMIGVWRGRQVEEGLSTQVNQELVDRLYDMYNEDIKKGARHLTEYVDLFDSKQLNPVQQDAVNLLTEETKEYIRYVFGENFYVRKDMLKDAIGERAISINELWSGVSNIDPKTAETIRKVIIAIGGEKSYKYLVKSEQFVQGTVASARNLIVVKSLVVPTLNIMANVLQLISRGVPSRNIIKTIPKKIHEIESYTRSLMRKIEAEAELRAATESRDKLKLQAEIQAIDDSHRRMSIWPLIEAGEFSTIADVGMSADDLELSAGHFGEYIERLVDKLPGSARTVGRYALITQDTALYKGLHKAVQYGDFVAKAILYDELTLRKKQTKEFALGKISEEFVNYDKSPGRFRQYLENMGLMWFFNFKIRISKIALSTIRNNPLHALLAMALPSSSPFGSIGFTLDDNLFAKMFQGKLKYTIGWGMGFRAPELNPWLNLFL